MRKQMIWQLQAAFVGSAAGAGRWGAGLWQHSVPGGPMSCHSAGRGRGDGTERSCFRCSPWSSLSLLRCERGSGVCGSGALCPAAGPWGTVCLQSGRLKFRGTFDSTPCEQCHWKPAVNMSSVRLMSPERHQNMQLTLDSQLKGMQACLSCIPSKTSKLDQKYIRSIILHDHFSVYCL